MQSQRSAIAVVTVVAATLLFWRLERHSLWIDELATWEALEGSFGDVVAWCIEDIHPPLYFVLLKGWVELVGRSDFTLRAFSVLAGLSAIVLMGAVAGRWLSPSRALSATCFLSLNPAFLELSRMARYYSLVTALGLASTLALYFAMERGRWRDWIAYGLTNLALVHTFYPSVLLVLAQVALVVRRGPKKFPPRYGPTVVGIAILSLPWSLSVGAEQLQVVGSRGGVELSGSLTGLVLGLAASAYTFAVGQTIYPWNPAAWCGLLAVSVLVFGALRWSRHRMRWRFLGVFVVAIGLMTVLIVFFARQSPFLNVPVRGLFALPFGAAILSLGLEKLASRRSRLTCISLLGVAWVVSYTNYLAARELLNPIHYTPGKEAARLISTRAETGDVVLAEKDTAVKHYLVPERGELVHAFTGEAEASFRLLAARPRRVWLVTLGRDRTRVGFGAAEERVRKELFRHYRLEVVERLLPVSRRYAEIKETLLGRRSYPYRLTVELFTLR